MAIQIYERPGFGELAGKAFSGGLSEGLTSLANMKLQELQERKQKQALKPFLQKFGLAGAEGVPLPLLQALLPTILKSQLNAPQEQLYAQLASQLLGGGQQEMSPEQQVFQPQQEQISMQQQQIPQSMRQQLPLEQLLQAQLPQYLQQLGMQQAQPQLLQQQQQLPQPEEQLIPQKGVAQKPSFKIPEGARLGGKQLLDLARFKQAAQDKEQTAQLKSEAAQLNKQKEINKKNKPFNDRLSKAVDVNEKIYDIAREMKELLDNGEVTENVGGYVPFFLLSSDSQRFQELSDALAPLIASQSGNPSNFKVKLAQSAKPTIYKKREVQKLGVKRLIQQAKKTLLRREIRDFLITENNGDEPANLETLVERDYKKLKGKD